MPATTLIREPAPAQSELAVVARAVAVAALYPVRLSLYFAFPPPPSRSKAAINLTEA
jgi:hypothetical protein